MSKDLDIVSTKDRLVKQIEELEQDYKDKSLELVECKSFSKEQQIKISMQEIEVKLKVLKRKIQGFSTK